MTEIVQEVQNFLPINLRYHLDKNKLSLTKLANSVNLPLMTIQRLISGETKDPRISTLGLIANYFDISIDDLVSNPAISSRNTYQAEDSFYAVPIVTEEMLEKASSIDELFTNKFSKLKVVNFTQKPQNSKFFILDAPDYLFPRFPKNTLFVIDPQANPSDGDLVVVKNLQNSTIEIEELSVNSSAWYLQQINVKHTPVRYDKSNHIVCGVVSSTMLNSLPTPKLLPRFTGIVEEIGEVISAKKVDDFLNVTIKAETLAKSINPGSHVVLNGVVLNVIQLDGNDLSINIPIQRLQETTLNNLTKGNKVNLEVALIDHSNFTAQFGAYGNVVEVGEITKIVPNSLGACYVIKLSAATLRYCCVYSSIAVEGTLLTIYNTHIDSVEIALTEFTLSNSVLGTKKPGDKVYVECSRSPKSSKYNQSWHESMSSELV